MGRCSTTCKGVMILRREWRGLLPALKRSVDRDAFTGALPDTDHRDAEDAEALLPRINAGAATRLTKLGGARCELRFAFSDLRRE